MGGGIARATVACALLLACVSEPNDRPQEPGSPTIHVLRPGENLYRVSRHYGVSVDAIVRANRIGDVTSLAVGRRLVIPGSGAARPQAALSPRGGTGGGAEQALRESGLRFAWPVAGRVSSRFGWRGGRRHEGIDIPGKPGTPIRAAEAGRVIHSGRLGAYGNVVIVKHAGRYSTVYAHNRNNRVRKGDFVEQGQTLGTVGRTGNASGNHVHFEVRRDRIAVDPISYLPERTARR